ncbi:hypothetical protein FQR65_LT07600 [Abscondita terminalis]|nr:hypothetical protein FQR65_LT07600 [Abscondita terminalis]
MVWLRSQFMKIHDDDDDDLNSNSMKPGSQAEDLSTRHNTITIHEDAVKVLKICFGKKKLLVIQGVKKNFLSTAFKQHIDDCLEKEEELSQNDVNAVFETAHLPETMSCFANCIQQKANITDSFGNINSLALYFEEAPYITEDMINTCVKEARASLQKKWRHIKDALNREKEMVSAIKSGSGATRKSQYVYYNMLSFLHEASSPTHTRQSLLVEDQDPDDDIQPKEAPTRKLPQYESTQSVRFTSMQLQAYSGYDHGIYQQHGSSSAPPFKGGRDNFNELQNTQTRNASTPHSVTGSSGYEDDPISPLVQYFDNVSNDC